MLDPAGTGLGVALGLVELGHRVEYTPAEDWPDATGDWVAPMTAELVRRCLGGPVPAGPRAADLLVLWDGFADGLEALARRLHLHAPYDPARPLRRSINPLAYPGRLACHLAAMQAADRVVVVDCSDSSGPREIAFERRADAVLLAREVPVVEAGGPWRPFPFLYHPVLLWLEWLQPRQGWLLPAARRTHRYDWVFCGSVHHPRYGDRRQRLLAEVAARWPGRSGLVPPPTTPFDQVLALLQSAGSCLDLPGAGEICYRMHEALCLDVPLLRPWHFTVAVDPVVAEACLREPPRRAPEPGRNRELYLTRYAPRIAASRLLQAARTQIGATDRASPSAAG